MPEPTAEELAASRVKLISDHLEFWDRFTTITGGIASAAGSVAFFVPPTAPIAAPIGFIFAALFAWGTNRGKAIIAAPVKP